METATNSKECVQEEDESFSKSVFKQGAEKEQRVLGMLWNPNQDELIHYLTKILEGVEVQPAKRGLILSTATRQLWSMGVVKSLITGRDGYHRGAVVRVLSGDRVVEMTRPLNRLYPVDVESQVREERQIRITDFPITFVGNAEQENVSEH